VKRADVAPPETRKELIVAIDRNAGGDGIGKQRDSKRSYNQNYAVICFHLWVTSKVLNSERLARNRPGYSFSSHCALSASDDACAPVMKD
jgi:hypothetical protein